MKNKYFLGREYLNKQKSLRQLSKQLKIQKSTLRDQMIKLGIPRRTSGRLPNNPQNIPFGYRLYQGAIILHKREQMTIQIIRKRRIVSKESYTQIARF